MTHDPEKTPPQGVNTFADIQRLLKETHTQVSVDVHAAVRGLKEETVRTRKAVLLYVVLAVGMSTIAQCGVTYALQRGIGERIEDIDHRLRQLEKNK